MKRICGIIVITTLAFAFAGAGFAQDAKTSKAVKKSVSDLEKALKKHNFGLVEDRFHEDFDYAGLGCGGHCNSSRMVVSMVVSTYPHEVQDIEVMGIEAEGPDYRARTTFTYLDARDNTEKQASFDVLMTEDGQFLEMELPGVRLQFGGQETTGTDGCGAGSGGSKGEE